MLLESIAFIIATTLMYSAPLIFTALGGVVSENAGVVNIGLEGMMTLGAFVETAVGYFANDAWIGFLLPERPEERWRSSTPSHA